MSAELVENDVLPAGPLDRCHTAAAARRKGYKAVHYVAVAAGTTVCGRPAGELVSQAPRVICSACKNIATPGWWAEEKTREDRSAIAEMAGAVDEAMLGTAPLVHIRFRAGEPDAAVYLQYNPLLLPLVRAAPGRRWDRAARCWRIPAVLADDLAARFRDAGAQVSSDLVS